MTSRDKLRDLVHWCVSNTNIEDVREFVPLDEDELKRELVWIRDHIRSGLCDVPLMRESEKLVVDILNGREINFYSREAKGKVYFRSMVHPSQFKKFESWAEHQDGVYNRQPQIESVYFVRPEEFTKRYIVKDSCLVLPNGRVVDSFDVSQLGGAEGVFNHILNELSPVEEDVNLVSRSGSTLEKVPTEAIASLGRLQHWAAAQGAENRKYEALIRKTDQLLVELRKLS